MELAARESRSKQCDWIIPKQSLERIKFTPVKFLWTDSNLPRLCHPSPSLVLKVRIHQSFVSQGNKTKSPKFRNQISFALLKEFIWSSEQFYSVLLIRTEFSSPISVSRVDRLQVLWSAFRKADEKWGNVLVIGTFHLLQTKQKLSVVICWKPLQVTLPQFIGFSREVLSPELSSHGAVARVGPGKPTALALTGQVSVLIFSW